MSKRKQFDLAVGFDSTGAPTKGVPVVGSGGSAPTEAGGRGNNFLQAVDVRGLDLVSIYAAADGGVDADFTIQGTNDPKGLAGWEAAAYKLPGGTTYITTALNILAGAAENYFLDPTMAFSFVRLNVSDTDGATLTSSVMGNL